MPSIRTSVESKRGCGYRKPGGLYLVSGGEMKPCGKLPLKLEVCPCCGQGIKPSRGWTWVDAAEMFNGVECKQDAAHNCGRDGICPLSDTYLHIHPEEMKKAGLLWIGERFYPTPQDWMDEGSAMGISRRIKSIPHDFKLGETWVLVAHRKTFDEPCQNCKGTGQIYDGLEAELVECPECKGSGRNFISGIFQAFRPTKIEYIVKGTETEEELERMEKRGISLVKVIKDIDQPELPVQDDLSIDDPDYPEEPDPEIDDGPYFCPDCERAGQFGEKCDSCRRAEQIELEDQNPPDPAIMEIVDETVDQVENAGLNPFDDTPGMGRLAGEIDRPY